MTTFAIGELPSKMKSLSSVLGLTFLSLTLTNCSLSPEQIASKVKPSIVLLYYKNQPGHGTGFFVNGEPGVCSVLTTAHVVDKEAKIRLRTENEGKAWDVATVEIFPNTIDLALVTFKPDTERCHYPQKQIYQGLGGTKDYDEKVWESFGDKVGWRKGGRWLSYDNLTFSRKHYTGHLRWGLPGVVPGGSGRGSLFSRAKTYRI